MTARWRGIRREFRGLWLMLWDAVRPTTSVHLSAVRQVTEQYDLDSAAWDSVAATQPVEEKAA